MLVGIATVTKMSHQMIAERMRLSNENSTELYKKNRSHFLAVYHVVFVLKRSK